MLLNDNFSMNTCLCVCCMIKMVDGQNSKPPVVYINSQLRWICGARCQRCSCVFGVLNIPGLYANHQNQMIANKFDISTDPIVYRYTKSTPVMLVSRKQRKKEDDFQNHVGTHQL